MKARIPKGATGGNMLEQLQKMQEEMERTTAVLEAQEYEVRAGGGLIRVVMDGKKQLRSIEIAPDIIDPTDVETLQDLIMAVMNEAIITVEQSAAKELEKITGGMNLPGIPGMPGMGA